MNGVENPTSADPQPNGDASNSNGPTSSDSTAESEVKGLISSLSKLVLYIETYC